MAIKSAMKHLKMRDTAQERGQLFWENLISYFIKIKQRGKEILIPLLSPVHFVVHCCWCGESEEYLSILMQLWNLTVDMNRGT